MRGISRREFAKQDGCSEGLVRQGIAKGKLVTFEDGSIDPSLVGTPWRKGNFGPKQLDAPPATEIPPGNTGIHGRAVGLDSFVEAQRRKENYLAKLRELEFEIKSGKLVDAEVVKARIFALAREDRDALANWPAQVAPLLGAELGTDAVKLAVALEAHVRAYLAERARLRRSG